SSATANIGVIVEHSGISNIFVDGNFYIFRHTQEGASRPAFVWESTYDIISQSDPKLSGPKESDLSLLKFLLEQRNLPANDLLLYTQPSAWSNLKIRCNVTAPGGSVLLHKIRLKITYDHSWAPQNQRVLIVKA